MNDISQAKDRGQAAYIAHLKKQLEEEKLKGKVLEQDLEQRSRELRLLNRVSQAFISTRDLDSVLATVLEEVRQALDVVACSAWLIDVEAQEVVCRQVTDPQSEIVRGWRIPMGAGFVGQVAEEGQSLNVPDTLVDNQHFKGVDQQTGLPIRSILSVPLRVKVATIGVIQAVDAKVNRFAQADVEVLEALAGTAAIALENVRLYEQARQDAETKSRLLSEVNHRVKNNLAAIIGLLYAERRHLETATQGPYQRIMDDLINRIQGLETVHRMLSASGWTPLSLSKLTHQIIHSALKALPAPKQVVVDIEPSEIQVSAKQANSLSLVINELTTNMIKYALNQRDKGRIVVRLSLVEERICFKFMDDGPGYPPDVLSLEQHNVGLYLIKNIVDNDLHGTVRLSNQPGAVVTLYF